MNVGKLLFGLALSLLIGSGVAVAADFDNGVKAAQSGNFKTALTEWAPLAELGHANAQYHLAYLYLNGDGVPQNYKTARKWFTLAAEQGVADAQYNLGRIYTEGHGVQKDDKTAFRWHTKAATQGHANAQYFLGFMYYDGYGFFTDKLRAYMWFTVAGLNGNSSSIGSKLKIAKIMSPAQIDTAQEMSIRCFKSNYTDCENGSLLGRLSQILY